MESKNHSRPIFVLFLTVFIDLLGFGIILPILPLYAEQFGANPNEATLLVAIYSLMQFLFAPLWGRFSDRYGRRPILLLTLFGSVIAYTGLSFANSLWMLFLARSLAGMMAGNISTAQAYIADITTPVNRARGMGIIGAAFGLGFILGPAIGGLLIGSDPNNANFHLPSLFAGGFSLLALLCALILLPESLNSETKAKIQVHRHRQRRLNLLQLSQRPQFCVLVGIYFLVTFAVAAMDSTLALWSKQQLNWGPQQTSYLFAFMGIVSTIIQGGLIGFLKKHFGEVKLLILGILGLGLGLLLIGFSQSLILLLVATTLVALGISISQPILNSLISQMTAPEEQGQILGIASSCSALARICGPTWAGVSFMKFGIYAPFLSGALVMLVALTLSFRVTKNVYEVKTERIA
ncbi:MFS transporter [Nostoc sp. 'Peltigera membranacea cyanobiont' N6]|uniref:MFS transporter n=1 Tax=Nostoc sp. 'Peltigera membranacea cyanobiont' N6 TaxID=1261031 RepID=UPI000CF3482E|nr:MFS transporter [Nostoc sp. 'Peltigera membranacea cyanobiont' N6]AVH62189.1 major facilitator superfamily transporter [Nostoc sp. 'Peltigera membranacea cyanobiont' N6]